jgi:hypothetical protein
MTLIETEYVIQQYYRVKPDEKAIDEVLKSFSFELEEDKQEYTQRQHRLFHTIMNNEKVLKVLLEYTIFNEHDLGMDSSTSYVQEYFEGDISFLDILLKNSECSLPEDREWLQSESADDFQESPLAEAFFRGVKASGFTIVEHRHARKEGLSVYS